jgi:hypothetical protein
VSDPSYGSGLSGYAGKPPLFELRRVHKPERSRHCEATADSAAFWREEFNLRKHLFRIVSYKTGAQRLFNSFLARRFLPRRVIFAG